MVRRQQATKLTFPPTLVDYGLIREIHAAVPREIFQHPSWSAKLTEGRDISSPDPGVLSWEIKDEPEVEEVNLYADSGSFRNHISLRCSSSGVYFSCECDQANEVALSIFTNYIKGVFNESREPVHEDSVTVFKAGDIGVLTSDAAEHNGSAPGVEKWRTEVLAEATQIELTPDGGKLGFWRGLNRQRITEDIISRSVSYVVIALVSGVVGYVIGRW